MPSLTTTVTTTTEVVLSPRLKRKLITELRAYGELKAQLDSIKAAMDEHKGAIQALREESGVASLDIEGFKIRHISPTRSVLDKKRLAELGCAASWLAEATVIKPTKSYEKVTCPGERDFDAE